MKFTSESRIAHSRSDSFKAYRDRLEELVPFLEDIETIEIVSRKEEDGVVSLHNRWVADQEIPVFAKAFVKKEMLCWDDFAAWDERAYRCDWEIKTKAFTEAVTCRGSNTFYEAGEAQTRVVLEGEFLIDLKKVRGVPTFLGKSLGPKLEKFIVGLISPNLQKVNQSIEDFLNQNR